MPGPLQAYLAAEHSRIDALLARAIDDPDRFDARAFERARTLLLRHIAVEEQVLLVDARRRLGGAPLAIARTLREEHAAIVSLLAPTSGRAAVSELCVRLAAHDPREEGPGGLHELCETLAGDDVENLIERAREIPAPKGAHAS